MTSEKGRKRDKGFKKTCFISRKHFHRYVFLRVSFINDFPVKTVIVRRCPRPLHYLIYPPRVPLRIPLHLENSIVQRHNRVFIIYIYMHTYTHVTPFNWLALEKFAFSTFSWKFHVRPITGTLS